MADNGQVILDCRNWELLPFAILGNFEPVGEQEPTAASRVTDSARDSRAPSHQGGSERIRKEDREVSAFLLQLLENPPRP